MYIYLFSSLNLLFHSLFYPDSGHEVTKSSSPPEPLVEYPLRDSVESANMSHHRSRPLENRGTLPTNRMMDTTANTQATPLENIPLEQGMDTTNYKVDNSRKLVSTSSNVPSRKKDVPSHIRGVLSPRTSALPDYGSIAQNQSEVAESDVDRQRVVHRNVHTTREQMSHLAQGTDFTHGDRSENARNDSLPRMGDLSNLTDQSQLTIK